MTSFGEAERRRVKAVSGTGGPRGGKTARIVKARLCTWLRLPDRRRPPRVWRCALRLRVSCSPAGCSAEASPAGFPSFPVCASGYTSSSAGASAGGARSAVSAHDCGGCADCALQAQLVVLQRAQGALPPHSVHYSAVHPHSVHSPHYVRTADLPQTLLPLEIQFRIVHRRR